MGEVYRARDTRLDRTVAIKVLPAELAADSQLGARFEREARAISALEHPNICTLYDIGEEDGQTFLVMEHLVGQTLAERLRKGPLPLNQALEVATQIADAVAAAHKQGIVHRDLKPGNVMLTKTGARLLDFGLARLTGHGEQPAVGSLTSAPTKPAPLTGQGTILGTLPYMAPEQVEGRPADARTDLWALGTILYEMVAGVRAFEASTPPSLVGAILERDPAPLSERQPLTPPSLERLVRRCLAKDPDERWDTAHDVADELRWVAETALAPTSREGPHGGATLRSLRLVIVLLGAAILSLGLVLALWAPWRSPPAPSALRLDTRLGPDLALSLGAFDRGPAAILSPDGTHLAFVAREPGEASRIYVRPLDQLEARPLSGTEGAESPFFSPDAQWIGFFAGGKLQKIALTGGAAVTLADAPDNRGGSWGEDGAIVLAPRGSATGVGLRRVSSLGGEIQTLTTPDPDAGEVTHRWPQVLGDGRVLYTAHSLTGGYEDASLVMETLPNGPRKVVHRGGYHGRYLPSGHLVFIHQGTLFAAPFDLERMGLTGPPVPAIEGVLANSGNAGAQFSFSDTGTLVYVAGEGLASSPIHWLGRDGATTPLRDEAARWAHPCFSPDGDRLAMTINDGTQWDIWIYEWSRDTLTRLTLDPADDGSPVWSPDGRHVVFFSNRGEKRVPNLYWRPSDGSGEVRRLTESESHQRPTSWHPSGRFLAFYEQSPPTVWDVKILEMEGDEASGWTPGTTTAFVESPFIERSPAFSPDGRFLAYDSNESGRFEVYVRPFPGPGGKWQVSADGGVTPTWSRTRPELLFATEGGEIMVSSYTAAGDAFRSGRPVPWSEPRFQPGVTARSFDLHPDGERVALRRSYGETGDAPDSVIVVFNFFDELRRLTAESGVAEP
jgi:serine/threonine-protein kinase